MIIHISRIFFCKFWNRETLARKGLIYETLSEIELVGLSSTNAPSTYSY